PRSLQNPLKNACKNNKTPAPTGVSFFSKNPALRSLLCFGGSRFLSSRRLVRSRCLVCSRLGLRCSRLSLLAQRMYDHTQHLLLRRGFAREYLELARALLHKHLNARNNRNALLASHAKQRRLQRVVDQIEHKLRIQVFGFKHLRRLDSRHPDRRRVDNDVELRLGNSIFLDRLRARLPSKLLRGLRCAIEDKDLCALIAQTENSSPGRTARAKHQHLSSAQRHALFERTRDAGYIG